MRYTTGEYEALCTAAEAGGHIVKLMRAEESGWGLQLVVRPCGNRTQWRAAGVLFPDLDELDRQATHLLGWLRSAASV